MLLYNLRLSWTSLRRNPALSLLTVTAIGLGIAVASSFTTIYYLMAADPLPHKSDTVRYVRLDGWDPDRSFSSDHPGRPPEQLTYRDAVAIAASDIPTHTTPTFHGDLFVYPEDPNLRPFELAVRLCQRGFFPIFEVPFAYGAPWDARADAATERVVVIDHDTNQRLFGGEDSVGRHIKLGTGVFTVVGVLEPWRPVVKFFDTLNDDTGPPEAAYIPFMHAREMQIATDGNIQGWKGDSGETYEDLVASETTWIQVWAQIDNADQEARYQAFLDGYTDGQRKLSRFGRPNNNWIQPMREWHVEQGVVPPEARSMVIISLLFLAVCSINLIGLLLGKFLARAPEVGVRRALGASRRAIFLQHIVECQLLGALGGLLGLALSVGSLRVISDMFLDDTVLFLDANMIATGIALALASGLIAGVYPAWRVCTVAPAIHLKAQ
ncbi:MAG: ABC transporter permease [Acidobacteriota bacterium]